MFASWQATWNCLTLAALWQASVAFTDEIDRGVVKEIETELSTVKSLSLSDFDGMAVLNRTYSALWQVVAATGTIVTSPSTLHIDSWHVPFPKVCPSWVPNIAAACTLQQILILRGQV